MNSEGNAPSPAKGEPPRVAAVCPHCGSDELIRDVRLTLTAETGSIGLSYKTNFLVYGTEPLRADLCRRCGTVVRFHVAQTDRNWTHH